jgi:hypothetical protein
VWSLLPEWQIAAQHRDTFAAEMLGQRHKEWVVVIAACTVRQDNPVPRTRRAVKKTAYRFRSGSLIVNASALCHVSHLPF